MSHRNKFTEDYQFEVRKEQGYDDYKDIFGYSVSLPHQCDGWEILGAEDDESDIPHNGGYPHLPVDKALAITQMELFIKRAIEALEELKNLD